MHRCDHVRPPPGVGVVRGEAQPGVGVGGAPAQGLLERVPAKLERCAKTVSQTEEGNNEGLF